MSLPELFSVLTNEKEYIFYYSKKISTSSVTYFKVALAQMTYIKLIESYTPSSYEMNQCLLRKWEDDTVVEGHWKFTKQQMTIERPNGTIINNIPIVFFETKSVLPKSKYFARSYKKLQCMYPTHVKQILIEDAIRKDAECPISYEKITLENAMITSCGHIFQEKAIKSWLSSSSSKGECPLCKQPCSL